MKLNKPTFAKKLTASYLFVVTVTLVLTGVFLTKRLKTNYLHQLEQSLSAQARLMREMIMPLVRDANRAALHDTAHRLGKEMGVRVTIVRNDGTVLGDSDRSFEELSAMDNHSARPEIQSALTTATGEAIRHSRTLHEDMLYLAIPIPSPQPSPKGRGRAAGAGEGPPWGALRVALPLTEVNRRVSSFHEDLLKAGAAALLVALLVAILVVRRTTEPLVQLAEAARRMGEGDEPGTSPIDSRDEFGELARAFNDMSGKIREKVQELSRERRQLGAILSSLVEGVIAVDHEGKVLLLNAAAEQLFEVKSEETRGRPALEVLRHQALHQVMQETLHEKRTVSQEITIHSPRERTLKVQTLPVSYGEGQTGMLAALYDITELRRLESLRQEFVANVSHELKTPLTAIKGYVETLLGGAMDDPKNNREFLKIIEEHARHLALLIDDVLDLSAIEAKRVKFRWESVSLHETMERLIKGLAPMAQAKSVTIQNKLSETLPKVWADRDKLAQILMNLLDNAIKFNKSSGRVEITAGVQGDRLALTIKDTGVGIMQEDLPRVFERFYRADKARSHEVAGTGLGLAIVKHLLEAHQGSIEVRSKPGEGSSFTVTLPCAPRV